MEMSRSTFDGRYAKIVDQFNDHEDVTEFLIGEVYQ